jgi:hypothetical protein
VELSRVKVIELRRALVFGGAHCESGHTAHGHSSRAPPEPFLASGPKQTAVQLTTTVYAATMRIIELVIDVSGIERKL